VRTRKLGVLVGVIALAFTAAGCGDDDSADYRSALVSEFTSDGEMSEDEANCIVDELEDAVGSDRLAALAAEADFEQAPPPEVAGAVSAAVGVCLDFEAMMEEVLGDMDTDIDIDIDELMEDFENN
jgi:hypothetical protein